MTQCSEYITKPVLVSFFEITGKKVILDLIEQATVAYDQREESQNRLFALKERDKVNVAMYGHEMRELQRELDHDIKLQEFLGKDNYMSSSYLTKW